MPLRRTTHWFGVVLDCPDPPALCRFYAQLLGWTVYRAEPGWAVLAPSEHHGYNLAFQREENHVAPRWPSRDGEPTMQAHLDLEVDDLAEAEAFARSVGARTHEHQPQEAVRVMLDPAGHLFCLYVDDEGGGHTENITATPDLAPLLAGADRDEAEGREVPALPEE